MRYAPWTPNGRDRGQAQERTLDEARFDQGCAGLSEDDAFAKAFRASEVERLVAELCRAADAIEPGSVQEWSAAAIACLNLMGIETLLPGEGSTAEPDPGTAGIHPCLIHLRREPEPDQLDALSGLIRDFQRSTGFVNGLRLVADDRAHWSLEAHHPGIVAAFGDFVTDKYVAHAWRLV